MQSEISPPYVEGAGMCVGAVGGGTEWPACSVTLFSCKDVSR